MTKRSILKDRLYYPECYIPERLLTIFEGNIKDLIEEKRPKFNELRPQKPKETERPEFSETIMLLLLPCGIGLFFSTEFFAFIIFILLIIGVIHLFISKKNYPKVLNDYNIQILEYQKSDKEYLDKLSSFHQKIEIYNLQLHRHTFINSLIRECVFETFKNSPYPQTNFPSPKKGRSEELFEKYLAQYFGNAILKDCTIEIFKYLKKINRELENNYESYDSNLMEVSNCYVPDFCFIHPTKFLKIDIEIDEPYSNDKAIHYSGSDNQRNKYFIEKNWLVLRFSELQVVKYPSECCREIAELIFDFTNDSYYINKVKHVNRLQRDIKWNLKESQEYIVQKLRNKYKESQNLISNVSLTCGNWENESVKYEFYGTKVRKIIKQKEFVESAWQKSDGIFFILIDNYNRNKIMILWDNNVQELLIIDYVTKDKLTITNMYTREIIVLKSPMLKSENLIKIIYDMDFSKPQSIEDIKARFNYSFLLIRWLLNKDGQKTKYLYHFDNENNVMLILDEILFDRLKNERLFN